MGPQMPEGPLVGHQPNRDPVSDADADLMCVDSAERDATPSPAEVVPQIQVPAGRVVDEAARRGHEAQKLADAVQPLGAVGHEAPKLDAGVAGALEVAPGHAARAAPEALGPLRERVRQEAEAAGLVHAIDDLLGTEAP